ncbi:hypothetical protein FQZ97_1068450 [compost metagenome]
MTIAYVAATPMSSTWLGATTLISTKATASSAAPEPSERRIPGTGAVTMPLTWPIRSWAWGISTTIAKRKSAGMTGRNELRKPSVGR